MSREIKFRAWDKEEKIMISADSLAFEEYAPISLLFADAQYHFEVMQYTGLKDKNGKEIYEGDILEEGIGYYFEVIWEEKYAKFKLQWKNKAYQYPEWNRGINMQVIGNIYENPKLLESEVE